MEIYKLYDIDKYGKKYDIKYTLDKQSENIKKVEYEDWSIIETWKRVEKVGVDDVRKYFDLGSNKDIIDIQSKYS